MRRGQQVEVLKTWAFGMPAQWFGGYTYVKADPRGGCLVRISGGHMEGSEVRYPQGSVRPVTCKSCSGQQFHRCRTGDKLCLHCSACGAMTSKDPRKLRRNDAYSPFPVDADQLRVGTAMEAREHGMSRAQAEKTAREHIAEDGQYYTKIAKMEKGSPLWGWDKLFTF